MKTLITILFLLVSVQAFSQTNVIESEVDYKIQLNKEHHVDFFISDSLITFHDRYDGKLLFHYDDSTTGINPVYVSNAVIIENNDSPTGWIYVLKDLQDNLTDTIPLKRVIMFIPNYLRKDY